MAQHAPDIEADIEAVGKIAVVPSLLEVVCMTTGMGFAAIARVTDKQWIACGVRDEINFGLRPGSELQLETTICHEIRQNNEAVIIDHVSEDPDFRDHHTPAMYGFQSYISIPIILKNGDFFGTLCAIDPKPAQLNNPKIIGMFRLFAELISFHLNALQELATSEARLLEEQRTAELREQFIAVLGHDLRNPLSAISNSAQLLQMQDDEEVTVLAGIIKNSSFRMAGLIENTLDFARGRLGGGLTLNRKVQDSLDKVLDQVVAELKATSPQRLIQTSIQLAEPVYCDAGRIAQVFSNLLGNALTYSSNDSPVVVRAVSGNGLFSLSVTNCCEKIPPEILNRIFQPFSRGEIRRGQKGLGLGLFIASEIARAHNGRMEVISTQQETSFTFSMPLSVSSH